MSQKTPKLPVQQLLILAICRFAEPVVLTSVLPYLPEMIESLGVPKIQVGKWAGITTAVTAGCQGAMAVPWGTASDIFGRKPIILLGLTFTMVFSLMFGVSQSLPMLLFARALQGLMNGNVGILRTMVAELVPEKELQPRGFSVMPLVWTVGSIFGPAFGGALAHPAEKHPALFGNSEFFKKYPFALPNMTSAALFIVGITIGFLFLRETLESKKDKRDYGLVLGERLTNAFTMGRRGQRSPFFKTEDERASLLGRNEDRSAAAIKGQDRKKHAVAKRPSWSQVFTPQSNLVLLTYASMAMHNMAFDSQFPVFLHYPVQQIKNNPDVQLPFRFAGGFGVDAQTIGLFYTIIGSIGMFIQFLFFPWAAKRYGILHCLKIVSIIFPILYFITPFTVLVPDSFRIPTIFLLMLSKLGAVIFSFPCCIILLTNSASSRSVLGTLNGIGTSTSSVGRAAGPAILGASFSFGINKGFVVIPWWTLAVMAALSAVPIFWIVETDGLADDDDDDDYVDDNANCYEDNENVDVEGQSQSQRTDGIYGSMATATTTAIETSNTKK